MKTPTMQGLFNKAVRGLAKQKWARSVESNPPTTATTPACVYFNAETGQRCAIGQLLSKEDAAKCPDGSIEGTDSDPHGSWVYVKKKLHVTADHAEFLGELQDAHDLADDTVRSMKAQLRAVGKKFKLKLPKEIAR